MNTTSIKKLLSQGECPFADRGIYLNTAAH